MKLAYATRNTRATRPTRGVLGPLATLVALQMWPCGVAADGGKGCGVSSYTWQEFIVPSEHNIASITGTLEECVADCCARGQQCVGIMRSKSAKDDESKRCFLKGAAPEADREKSVTHHIFLRQAEAAAAEAVTNAEIQRGQDEGECSWKCSTDFATKCVAHWMEQLEDEEGLNAYAHCKLELEGQTENMKRAGCQPGCKPTAMMLAAPTHGGGQLLTQEDAARCAPKCEKEFIEGCMAAWAKELTDEEVESSVEQTAYKFCKEDLDKNQVDPRVEGVLNRMLALQCVPGCEPTVGMLAAGKLTSFFGGGASKEEL